MFVGETVPCILILLLRYLVKCKRFKIEQMY